MHVVKLVFAHVMEFAPGIRLPIGDQAYDGTRPKVDRSGFSCNPKPPALTGVVLTSQAEGT